MNLHLGLVDKNDLEEEWIDVEDQQKFEKYKKKDMLIDEGLEEVINVNREVKAVAKAANQKIDETNVKIQQNLVKVNQVEEQVQKGQRDLEEVLKHVHLSLFSIEDPTNCVWILPQSSCFWHSLELSST